MLLLQPGQESSILDKLQREPACWTTVFSEKIGLSARRRPFLVGFRTEIVVERDAGKKQAVLNGIHAQTYVVKKGARHSSQLRDWNEIHRKLSPKEMGILDVACAIPRRLPTEQQVPILIAAEKRAISDGFKAT